MPGNKGFLGNIQHSVNSFFYSLTTNDRYASYDSPYRESNNRSSNHNGLPGSNNNSSISLVDNTGSNRSSTSNNRPFLYRPGLRSQLQNNASGDVQLQDYIDGLPPLPSIDSIWERLELFLDREYPEMNDYLGGSATVSDLNELESDLEITLPSDVRESFQIHDGQESNTGGLVFGLILLELDAVSLECEIWRRVCTKLERAQYLHQVSSNDTSSSSSKSVNRKPVDFISKQRSIPEGAIQPVYAHPHWIPLARDFAGNNIAVDLAPGPTGRWGQIILFGRDFDTKYVIASSWTEFLLNLVEDFEDDKFIIDPINETLFFAENGKPIEYLKVLVHRAWAPIQKASLEKLREELYAKTTALRSKNNSKVDLPKHTLIVPDLEKEDSKIGEEEHEIKLDDEELEEEMKDDDDGEKVEEKLEVKPEDEIKLEEEPKPEEEIKLEDDEDQNEEDQNVEADEEKIEDELNVEDELTLEGGVTPQDQAILDNQENTVHDAELDNDKPVESEETELSSLNDKLQEVAL